MSLEPMVATAVLICYTTFEPLFSVLERFKSGSGGFAKERR